MGVCRERDVPVDRDYGNDSHLLDSGLSRTTGLNKELCPCVYAAWGSSSPHRCSSP